MRLNVNLVVLPTDLAEKLDGKVRAAAQYSDRIRDEQAQDVLRQRLNEAFALLNQLRDAAQPLVVGLDVNTTVAP